MILEKEVDKSFSENKSFILTSGVYILSSLIDFISTYYGISNNLVQEINPISLVYIKHFGLFSGLLIPKVVLSTLIIAGTKYIDFEHKQGRTRFKAEYILYPAVLLTSLTSLSWIIDNCFYK